MRWNTVWMALAGLLRPRRPGCLTVADDEGPILSIELFWDARPESTEFFGAHLR